MQWPSRHWRRTGIATSQLSTLTVQQHTATQTTVAASLSPLAPQVTLESTVSGLSRPANDAHPSKPKRKLYEQPSNWYRRMSPSTNGASFQNSMLTLQHIQNLHPSQQAVNSDENKMLHALASRTDRVYNLTFTRCSSNSGISGNELADVASNEGTAVEKEGVSHHHDSEKAAIQQATKEPLLPTSVYVASTAKEEKK